MFFNRKSYSSFFIQSNKICALSLLLSVALLLQSCSPIKRVVSPGGSREKLTQKTIRVILDTISGEQSLQFKIDVILKTNAGAAFHIKQNSDVTIVNSNGQISISAEGRNYSGTAFSFAPSSDENHMDYKGKRYKGELKVMADANKIYIVNVIGIEDYLKGVLPLEMGNISGKENFEALKAFSIIARNYSVMKLDQRQSLFDVYPDTRDQVYGGFLAERDVPSRAVDETRGLLLTYSHAVAKVFYFSSCGGVTEDVGNVFSEKNIPYLVSVKDNEPANCSISPGFSWIEKYTGKKIVERLFESRLITNKDYACKELEIKSRFNSGRVNELDIKLTSNDGEEKDVKIYGNNIRSIIKQSGGKGILKSAMFDIQTRKTGDDIEIIIKGKGNGHGVGLCQWGAIAMSRKGADFTKILSFYFPGTKIERIDDRP